MFHQIPFAGSDQDFVVWSQAHRQLGIIFEQKQIVTFVLDILAWNYKLQLSIIILTDLLSCLVVRYVVPLKVIGNKLGITGYTKSATSHTLGHIRAKLSVGCTCIYIGASDPIAKRVDDGSRVYFLQGFAVRHGLTDDELLSIKNVLSIIREQSVDIFCDIGECSFLFGDRYTFKDTVISTADFSVLVISKMYILLHLHDFSDDFITCDTCNGSFNVTLV